MKHPDRPAQIVTMLKTIGSEYSADVGATLEVYISSLEANQLVILPNDNYVPSQDQSKPPMWSHMRVVERENHRRERALRKQNNYR
jgi:hypothetical protein